MFNPYHNSNYTLNLKVPTIWIESVTCVPYLLRICFHWTSACQDISSLNPDLLVSFYCFLENVATELNFHSFALIYLRIGMGCMLSFLLDICFGYISNAIPFLCYPSDAFKRGRWDNTSLLLIAINCALLLIFISLKCWHNCNSTNKNK